MAVKVGFAGCGYIAGVHMANLTRDQRVEITCAYDPDASRAGAIGVKDFDTLLSRVDAVYVTAPNTLHADLARRAVAAGKHVFCEKPLATTLDAARHVLEAAQSAPAVFQIGFNRRFAPVYRRVKELLDSAAPHCAHIKMNRGELLKPAWTADDQITGGFLFETPIHMFDMMRFQFGEVAAIDARLSQKNDFSMLIEFQNGFHATFVTSADASWFFPYERLEIFGEYSTIETEEVEAVRYRIGLDAPTRTDDYRDVAHEIKMGFAEGDRLFIDAILGKGTPPVTALDGCRAVELACACYQSAREKRRIALA
ncbi:MAG TPA: Gfo/Idh/MocA family oxidoreductase [Bryobacteraceae bacterium]|nr:Gfo/Idh/MocA family oxidoreductase [Bryobacteraceae bacterium]